MRGIILAAGRGSRMGDLTEDQPKCLTVLAGKSLLDWQLSALHEAGVDPIALVTGYLSNQLEIKGQTVFHNARWAETNMVMSLMASQEWLRSEPCIVSYADIVYHPDHIRQLCQTEGDLVITYDRQWYSLWSERFDDPLSDAETFRLDATNQLVEIGKKTKNLSEIQGQYMGLLKFTPSIWAKIELLWGGFPTQVRDRMDMTTLLNHLLVDEVQIQTVGVEGMWCEVDSGEDLLLYEQKIEDNELGTHDWRF
jgi:L-glutamine-phosphate cytidylyltransferase